MKIAIIGAGIAGLTAGFLLAEQGHEIELFEQANECLPVGAGFLLQPSGQNVLRRLNMLDPIEAVSPRLNGIKAETKSGRSLVSIPYSCASSDLYGLGVKRSTIHSLVLIRAKKSGVKINTNMFIEKVIQDSSFVVIKNSNYEGSFDFAIAADGSRSAIRSQLAPEVKTLEYNYAALWTLSPISHLSNQRWSNSLWQLVDGTTKLLGVLPVEEGLCSFFWGIRRNEKERIWQIGLDSWKEEVLSIAPMVKDILDTITSLDQLTYASYRHARITPYFRNRVIFIGDAAHASSPHLGQGVNLALEDAECLALSISQGGTVEQCFNRFEQARATPTRYYSMLTAILSPFFQSDYELLGWGRDFALAILPKLPFIKKQMALSMAGLKQGWLRF
ncbi:MAG TPA: NAD(P)/FAD-dependent oxidoreductase [Oligoflexia bacterium]|nr:NAD(P)/FAD-dependent oxidoreductase [Oligoflexia bacterium]HMP48713.1 NAD(P)/FAD-dependent oxidoreductase [Oligoflexia bacterium]